VLQEGKGAGEQTQNQTNPTTKKPANHQKTKAHHSRCFAAGLSTDTDNRDWYICFQGMGLPLDWLFCSV